MHVQYMHMRYLQSFHNLHTQMNKQVVHWTFTYVWMYFEINKDPTSTYVGLDSNFKKKTEGHYQEA